MISTEGGREVLVLMDFNAACKAGGLTPTGTRQYMSPEAWRSMALLGEMTDMWSVGVCLYFMLTGYLPWVGRRLHVLALEVCSFPLRFPAGLTEEALSLLTGLLCRNVATRLMVVGALTHPWCKLCEDEARSLFSLQISGAHPPQPSYRDWEIKARKQITCGGNTDVFGPGLETPPGHSPLRRTASWPVLCSESNQLASAHLPPHSQPIAELECQHYFSSLASAGSCTSPSAPGCKGWEVKLRREQLRSLYGPPVCEPAYRNWETKERRRELLLNSN